MSAIDYRVRVTFTFEGIEHIVDGLVPVYDGEGLGKPIIYMINGSDGTPAWRTDELRAAAVDAMERAAWRAHDERNGR